MDALRLSDVPLTQLLYVSGSPRNSGAPDGLGFPVTMLLDVSGSPYRGITMAYPVYMLRYIGVYTSKLIRYSLAVVPIRIVMMEGLLLTRVPHC